MTVVENDIAILKVKNPHVLKCTERKIWPACLPEKVHLLIVHYNIGNSILGEILCWRGGCCVRMGEAV